VDAPYRRGLSETDKGKVSLSVTGRERGKREGKREGRSEGINEQVESERKGGG